MESSTTLTVPRHSGLSPNSGYFSKFVLFAAVAVILLWIAALYWGAASSELFYFSPVVIGIAFAAAYGIFSILRGSGRALLGLLFLSMLLLELDFWQRAPGESGLNPQNGIKILFWAVMLMAVLPHWRDVLGLLKTSISCRAAFCFCFFCATSVLWSDEPATTAASAIGLFAAFALSLLLAVRVSAVDVHRAYFWALSALIIIACVSYFVAPSVALLPPSEGETSFRLQGLSGHPNLLGQQAAILLLMAYAMWEAKAVPRLYLSVIAVTGTAVLLLTESRTSLAGVIAAIVIVGLRQAGLLKLFFFAALASAATIVFLKAFDLIPDVAAYLGGLTRSGSTSELTTFTGRTELWKISWELFLQKPWFGWGYNANEQLMLDSVGPNFAGNAVNSHNMLMQALVTMGIVGTTTVLAFVGGMARNMIFRPNPMRDRIFIYLMVLGLAEAEFLTLPVITIYLAFWSLADAAIEARGRVSTAEVPTPLLPVQPVV